MKLLIYITVCIATVFFRTVFLCKFPPSMSFYDPLLVFILCTVKKSGAVEGCLFSILAGLYTDGLSNGGTGFFLASYVWFFLTARLAGMYFRIESPLITAMLLISGVLIQNMVFCLPELMNIHDFLIEGSAIKIIRGQSVWMILTGIPLYNFFSAFMNRSDGISGGFLSGDDSSADSGMVRR